MAAQILDGKTMARKVLAMVQKEALELRERIGRPPGLTVVRVGENSASEVFVRQKLKACAQVGIIACERYLPADISLPDLLNLVDTLGQDPEVDGILVQLPLPSHLPASAVMARILPSKDVDGFTPLNMGRLVLGDPCIVPCTALGVLEMLRQAGIALSGRHAVIVGRSSIVGKPLSLLLLREDATITLCHSRTRDLFKHTSTADILVVAAGRAGMITAPHVKQGAVVVDVGINRVGDRLVGDVVFDEVSQKASALSPVPGGVGPMTVAMVCKNTVFAATKRLAGKCNGSEGI